MELLITISIMGILSAVVVFGVGNFGNTSSCLADAKMLRNGESSFYVSNGRYGTQAELLASGLIPAVSTLHDVQVAGLNFTLTELNKCVNSGTGDAGVVAGTTFTKQNGFTVLVAASDGTPVAGATITYRQGGGAWSVMGTTGAAGTVNAPLAEGTYDIEATLYGATNQLQGIAVQSGTLMVLPTVALTTQLLDVNGVGVANAAMSVRHSGANAWQPIGTTAPGGGGFTVQVLPGDYDAQAVWNTSTDTRSAVTIAAATTVTFRMTRVSVKLHTAAGSAVVGATVVARIHGSTSIVATVVSAANGVALEQLLPGNYDLSASYTPAGATLPTTVSFSSLPVASTPIVAELTVP